MGYVYIRAEKEHVEDTGDSKQVDYRQNQDSRPTPQLQRLI